MTDERSQMPLWQPSTQRSASEPQSWPHSSEPATRSRETDAAATKAPPTRPVARSATPRSVAHADSSPSVARRMVRSAQLALYSDTTSIRSTDPDGPSPQRPTTRGECCQGPRPCPWVSCRHHLLISVTTKGNRIRLNAPSQSRRPTLSPRASDAEAEVFSDQAVEMLAYMGESCALDVADEVAEAGIPIGKRRLGRLLRMTPNGALFEIDRAVRILRAAVDVDSGGHTHDGRAGRGDGVALDRRSGGRGDHA